MIEERKITFKKPIKRKELDDISKNSSKKNRQCGQTAAVSSNGRLLSFGDEDDE